MSQNKPFHLTPASLPTVARSAAGERQRWIAVNGPEDAGHMEHHSTKWYLALAAIAAGAQATALLAASLIQFATFEHAESRRYVLAALDQFVRVLSGPLLLFYRPEWASWLRPHGGDDRWIVSLFVVVNAFIWGVALASVTWWWQRSSSRGRRLGLLTALAVFGLVVVVAATRTIYCHGDFSGVLHCHVFVTPDHDH